ncbi:uncharacterized protein LOC106157225 isoform X2 [Lingula anatina]|uniref:Uncharacterized protein LOC106157225 isoform X2 n=1 Tax=Lingula anatina TaxID=7574 RepID=A0A1S3HT86_LINAN|nr:uncharacterized protein LOC106157225 isoform X2 [Lingula anatina]|eukprot:XP_013388269.1 uncharacterized protein LOC106157225 isoform X2 [Lingula anatina]
MAVFCAGDQSCDCQCESDWSACTASCGGGLQTRSCSDSSIVTRVCNPQACVRVLEPLGFWPLQIYTKGRDCSRHGNNADVQGVSFKRGKISKTIKEGNEFIFKDHILVLL